MRHYPEPVEDYTNAFLATFGLLLFMAFWVIATIAGFIWVVLVATGLDRSFRMIGRNRR